MCLNPKWIYKTGKRKENGYRGQAGELYEIGTYSKCGTCEQCIASKCNDWVCRNFYEAQSHKRKCFITLTYKESPFFIVEKDGTDFMKRFRTYLDRTTGEKVRMFGVYEYGTLNQRPHIHFIIYGWDDKDAKHVTMNKKKKQVLKSEIIEKIWGLGITSYQDFNEKEIPYVALYNTPAEAFKNGYKMTREKAKKIEQLILKNNYKNRDNILFELKEINKKMDEEKAKYKLIREKNTWSQGLGWEAYYHDFCKQKTPVFEIYIEDKVFPVPCSWVKRLANLGYVEAIEEMYRRENEFELSASDAEEKRKNYSKVFAKRIIEKKGWNDKKSKIESTL